MRRDRRSLAELAACPPSELSRIALDVGLSHTDLRSLSCSHPGPSEFMPWRLQRLGLDPAYVKVARTATYRAKGDVQVGMRGYCLNALTIDALTVERPITPHV